MIYLDHHATTPCAETVVDRMLPFFSARFGNPSSKSHGVGRDAARAVEEARAALATLLAVSARELTFTAGATEALNLALRGLVKAYPERRRAVVSAFEHKAVLDTARALEEDGLEVVMVPCDARGIVTPALLEAALDGRPALFVAIMAAQNELGTIQPIAELAAVAKRHQAFFVCDAVQAVGRIPFRPGELGVDLAALSAHKLYGPKGVGALWVRGPRTGGPTLLPIMTGGGQEQGLRPGTLNVPGIVGLGAAAELAAMRLDEDGPHLHQLRDLLLSELRAHLQRLGAPADLLAVTCGEGQDAPPRLPGSLHLTCAGLEGFRLLQVLGGRLALSSGSACSSERRESSHVLDAIHLPEDRRFAALRIGLGRDNTEAEVRLAADLVASAIDRLRPR